MLSHGAMRSLALVRYLHAQAIEQERKGDLLAGLALLPLHDAIELFLWTAAVEKNVMLGTKEFLGYWDVFEKAGFALPSKTQMVSFNHARVELKHRGALPGQARLPMIAPGLLIPSRRGDIDAIAHEIAVGLLDDVAEMNAEAELDTALGRQLAWLSAMPFRSSARAPRLLIEALRKAAASRQPGIGSAPPSASPLYMSPRARNPAPSPRREWRQALTAGASARQRGHGPR
jgi:hypothetical protein